MAAGGTCGSPWVGGPAGTSGTAPPSSLVPRAVQPIAPPPPHNAPPHNVPPHSVGALSLRLESSSEHLAASTTNTSSGKPSGGGKDRAGPASSSLSATGLVSCSSRSSSGLVFLTPTERMLLVSCMDVDPNSSPALFPLSLLGGGVNSPVHGSVGEERSVSKGHVNAPPSAMVTMGRIASSRSAVAVSLVGMHMLAVSVVMSVGSVIVALYRMVHGQRVEEWPELVQAVFVAICVAVLAVLSLRLANRFSLKWSALCSLVGVIIEASGLVVLRRRHSATISTVIGGTLFLQGLLGCICIMFGVLWFRAVERVRASVIERTSVARFVSQVMTGLCTEAKETMLARLVVFQAAVRRRQAIRLRWRLEAMEAYDASGPQRNHLLWLLNAIVGLYIVLSLYIIGLYAIKFSSDVEVSWLLASVLGFTLDVLVYHTFSLWVRAVMKLLITVSVGTDRSTLATGLARGLEMGSCAFSGANTI